MTTTEIPRARADASGTTTYTWDFENRLTAVTMPGTSGTVAFKYDPFGRRIQQSSASGATNYLYEGSNTVADLDGTGNLVARYTQGAGIDEPLAQLRSGTVGYYDQDGLGSVTTLSSTTGTIGNSYTYDSFGNLVGSTGSVANPFQYTGRDFDSETGLRYYRARYYDPLTGRFIGEDPMQFLGSINFYSYVGNSPVGANDPSGLCKVQMLYSPVKVLGITFGYHAFVVVSNNTGGPAKPLNFRAGPGSGGTWWTPDLFAQGVPYINDPSLNPDWDPHAIS
jgi:RHS repeat-associated protein